MGQKPVEIKPILVVGDSLATGDITIGGFFYYLFIRQFSGFNEQLLEIRESRERQPISSASDTGPDWFCFRFARLLNKYSGEKETTI